MSDLLNKYVKFMRGTQAAYDALTQKDDNTLYFITDENKGYGALYMGANAISGGDIVVASASLDDLKDVIVSEAETNSFLVKDGESWIAKSLEDVVNLIQGELDIDSSITEDITNLNTAVSEINTNIESLETAVAGKADASALESKADTSYVDEKLGLKADASTVNAALADKANSADVTAALANKADASTVNAALAEKANSSDVNTALANKADTTYVDEKLAVKANSSDVSAALDLKADKATTYTKLQVDALVAEKIVEADHLRRIIVDNKEAIDVNAEDALFYIYMVPSGLEEDDNKYYEYIVIEYEEVGEDNSVNTVRTLERVGSWEVNLDNYALKTDVTQAVNAEKERAEAAEKANSDRLDVLDEKVADLEGAEANYISSVNESNFKVENGKLDLNSDTGRLLSSDEAKKLESLVFGDNNEIQISGNVHASKVQELYANVVRIVTNSGTYEYDGEQKELLGIEKGAEVNVVGSVSNEFTISEDAARTLSINLIDASKITNLANNETFAGLSSKVDANAAEIVTIKTNVATNAANIVTVSGRVDTLDSNFSAYKLQTDADIAELKNILTWKSIGATV